MLRGEVLELLANHAEGVDPLDAPLPWPDAPVVPAQLGPYRVLDLIGQGGMGVVYRAQLAEAGDEAPVVALKVLRPGIVTTQIERRFRREVEVLRRLDHEGIARLHDAGSAEGSPYLAMEFVAGLSLARWRSETEPSLADRLRLLADLCDAVHYAHTHDVVHRDLKPENILVTPEGRPKVLDFGIARLTDEAATNQTMATQTWQLLGTIRYMSPEQAAGGPAAIDARTDVYALGVIAYELLTGELPYDLNRLSTPRALLEITTALPRQIGGVAPDLRGDVELIVHHALEKRPPDRYPTAGAMAEDLRRQLAGRPISLRQPGPIARARRELRRRPRLRRLALGLAIAVAAVAVTLAIGSWLRPTASASWPRLYALLEEADQLRHSGPATRENYLAAANLFHQARTELAQLTDEIYTNDLNRYIKWRLGELLYFVAGMDHDAARFEQARGMWHDAQVIPWTRASATAIPEAAIVRGKVLRLGLHHPLSGAGMARVALAELRSPVTHLREAVQAFRSREELCAAGLEYYHYDAMPPELVEEDRGYALQDLGAALVSYGAVVDSLAVVDRGIMRLQSAVVHPGLRGSSGLAHVHHALGGAFLARAETGAASLASEEIVASLDSVWLHLDLARDNRDLGSGRMYWALYRLRGHANEFAATVAPSASERLRLLAAGAEDLRRSLAPLREDADAFEIALSRADLAVLEARFAREERTLAGFSQADSLLASAEGLFTSTRFPLQHAETALRRGCFLVLRGEVSMDQADSLAAERALERASISIPRVEYPALHRRVAALVTRLRGGVGVVTRP